MKNARLILAFAMLLTGCATMTPPPHTRFGVNPFTHTFDFDDTKNNDVTLKDLKYDAASHDFSLAELSIHNNASDVIGANVSLMAAYNEQLKTQTEALHVFMDGMSAMTGALTGLAHEVMPYLPPPRSTSVGVTLPNGASIHRDSTPLIVTPAPTSQPIR